MKLARFQAPAGGAITNNTYQQGGQFLPKALGRIRAVMDLYVAKHKKKKTAPVKLGRPTDLEAGLEHAKVAPDQAKLTRDQMAKIEDLFLVPEAKRISNKKTITKQHIGQLLNHVNRSELGPKDLRRILRNPDHPEVMKNAVLGLVTRAEKKQHEPSDFYTGAVKHVDEFLPTALPGTNPTLVKLVLAYTSGNLDPKDNFATAMRMIREGRKRGGPAAGIASIPPNNEPALKKWRDEHPDAGEPPDDPGERIKWAVEHSGRGDAPFKSMTGHLHKGEPFGYYHGDTFIPLFEGAGKLFRAATREGNTTVQFPTPGQPMTPKGWSQRGNVIEPNLEKTKRILSHFGGDEAKAAEWLLSYHPAHEVAAVAGIPKKDISRIVGYYERGEEIPGSFAFGPKFGAYHWNLHTNEGGRFAHQLTADMWWARLWNRMHGTLFHDVSGQERKTGGAAAPRNNAERKRMWEVAKRAAAERGTTVSQLQADLWSTEQKLWSLFGLPNSEVSYRHGIDAAKKQELA